MMKNVLILVFTFKLILYMLKSVSLSSSLNKVCFAEIYELAITNGLFKIALQRQQDIK